MHSISLAKPDKVKILFVALKKKMAGPFRFAMTFRAVRELAKKIETMAGLPIKWNTAIAFQIDSLGEIFRLCLGWPILQVW